MKRTQLDGGQLPEETQSPFSEASWARAQEVVAAIQPIITPIRHICQTTLGDPSKINGLLEGAIIPLRRIVLACGHDSILAEDAREHDAPLSVRQVLENLPSDVIAAALVVHSVGRRLRGRFKVGMAGAFIEEALTRAAMGLVVGKILERFGAGRAMLAGFSSRAGMAMIVAEGSDTQAMMLLEKFYSSESLQDACLDIYRVDPLHVGALLLLAAGCGSGACMGIVGCSMSDSVPPSDDNQLLWWAVHLLIDQIATKHFKDIPDIVWETLGFKSLNERQDVYDLMQAVAVRGNGWLWLI